MHSFQTIYPLATIEGKRKKKSVKVKLLQVGQKNSGVVQTAAFALGLFSCGAICCPQARG